MSTEANAPTVKSRVQTIRKRLEQLREACRLSADDYLLDWMASEIERDEKDGLMVWDETKKKKVA